MALTALDRLLTIVVTATLTSAGWIVAGGTLMERARDASQVGGAPADAAPSLDPVGVVEPELGAGAALTMPVLGVRPADLTDTFADARGGGRVHDALDIMAPEGTAVVAAAPGMVERLFLSDEGGKTVYVRSNDRRTIYYYAHLKDYAAGLKEGQTVRPGQRLGSVGYTGNADPAAPHLHFAILRTTPDAKWWEPATPVNPYPLLAKR
jgi:peptidoglycan LD-endopeptidase LytH